MITLGADRSLRVVDLARRVLVVMGKGQKARALPLRGGIVLAAEGYLLEELEGVGPVAVNVSYRKYA